ncbi:DNA mismatch repair protein MutS [Bacteriovorax sp. Seq25_V]|uniref:DNA mismatch repair protein MutS n=1 Tax=Bacteriovorax sp. Seq25_V TaxID=1201288 RepID=UPI00038A5116|nr:DNA mismatch repair protein MutS [Bacteriovorax sp. Seq25_V]EQC45297.1 DNA mismatch repair protein MutS [Bacteriovorax sp. Seq25_V]
MTLQIESIVNSGTKLTPMMEQYFEIKTKYLDHLLLFRMGDFYEVFFEDAKTASQILNIALTHRGKVGDHPIPMAGIPHHAAATYIDRFASHGIKVAICEQVEDPKEAKGIVKRAVTQVVSPGMPYDLEKTNSNETHFIVSTFKKQNTFYITALDFTTGVFKGFELNTEEDFLEKIRNLAPKEFITFLGQWDNSAKSDDLKTLLNHMGTLVTNLSKEYFESTFTEIYIEKLIPTYKRDQVLVENDVILNPIGALSYYVSSTQNNEDFVHIQPFSLISETGYMKVTIPTLTGLEILPKSRETYHESLLGFMDKTKTALGARTLRDVFTSPLTDVKKIKQRQSTTAYFLENEDILQTSRELLSNVRDLERILAKVSTNKANAGDLLNISGAINVYQKLSIILKDLPVNNLKELPKENVTDLLKLAEAITVTINDEIGANLEKGNLIKPGANKERDRLAGLSQNASAELLTLETKYRNETGIQKLKIKSNNVAGYFIEVSKTYTDKVPPHFIRRQTLVNSERYSTQELNEFEKELVIASERLQKLEREIFKSLIEEIIANRAHIQLLATILAKIDVLQSFAWIARSEDFICPELSTKSKEVSLKGAWHPLIKAAIKDQFVSHDLNLDHKKYFGLITGPNMAGKTTVMREVAIIQLLTQIGSFVPADSVKVSVCDYLFSRLGASDDILKGQSTFMVEMAETAEILRHATENSLIILDEVGRGTSTYDGLSIAWALVEHFIEKTKSICLFATHYHELIDLVDSYDQTKNLTVETMNHNGDVKFLYRLIEKAASQSFGIYVAKLAGIPNDVLKRSQQILKTLEKNHNHAQGLIEPGNPEQLNFFSSIEPEVYTPEYLKDVEEAINSLDLNNLTPIQALNKLQELKDLIQYQ